jgi:hypothetical protein
MTWEDRPERERPADDAEREVWWMQGGVPIARMKLVKCVPGLDNEWVLGELEHVMFGGRSVELCYWFWARDKVDVTDRYKKGANEAAARLESLAAALREVGKQ